MMSNSTTAAVETTVRLEHRDSQFCWCEPVVALDEDGKEVVVHREVTWN